MLRDRGQKFFKCVLKKNRGRKREQKQNKTRTEGEKPPKQILTLRKTTQHGKFILQKIVPLLNTQILTAPFGSLFPLFS